MTPAPTPILVTGGSGFVGRHILSALRRTFPTARLIAAARGEELVVDADEVRPFDLLEPETIEALVAECRPQACFHLAALSAVGGSFDDPDSVWRANVDGTRSLGEALRRHAPTCPLLFASSVEVYGLSFLSGQPLDEDAVLRPANPYAAAKAAADIYAGELALRGVRTVRLRPANHVGPGQSARFAVAAFARQIARIEAGLQSPVITTGALDRWRDFLDVRDVCDAYVRALSAVDRLAPGVVFNIASGRTRCIRDVLHDLLRLAGVSAEVAPAPSALRPFDVASVHCSAAAARALLDWTPTVPWEQTLTDVLEFWRAEIARGGDHRRTP